MKFETQRIIKICDWIIEISFLAIVFLVPVYFAVAKSFVVFELYKLAIFRFLLSLILLAYLAKIFVAGKVNYVGKTAVFCLTLLLALSFFISSYFSLHPFLSFWGNLERQQGFYSLIGYLLFFCLLVLNLKNFKQIKRIIITATAASVLVCAYGLVQYFGLDPLAWQESAFYIGRIFSSLAQPNFLGHYLILVIPLTFYSLIFIARNFISRFILIIAVLTQLACLIFTYSRAAWLGFFISWCFGLLLFLLIKNYKKTALILVLIGLIFFALIIYLNFNKPIEYLSDYKVNFTNRLKSYFDFKSGSNQIRIEYWRAAVQEIQQMSWPRLVFGYGPETQPSIFVKYYQPDWAIFENLDVYPDRAHNAILDLILSFGLFGLLANILFYGYFILIALQSSRPAFAGRDASEAGIFSYLKLSFKPKTASQLPGREKLKDKTRVWLVVILLVGLVAYFVNNLFSFSLTTAYLYLFLYLALVWFLISDQQKEKEVKIKLSRPSKILIWFALLAVLSLFIYYKNINAIRADCYYYKAMIARGEKNCQQILTNISKSIAEEPYRTFYQERYLYYGLNCFSAEQSKESQLSLGKNLIEVANLISQKEYLYSAWQQIAHLKSILGFYLDPVYYQAAEEDYQRLIVVNPFISANYKDLGRMKLWQKEDDQAISNFDQALTLLPPLDHPKLNRDHREVIKTEMFNLYQLKGQTLSYKKDYQLALNYFQQALKLKSGYPVIYKDIADVYYQQGDLDKAIFYNLRGLNLNPTDYHWWLGLALLYQQQGDKNKTLEYANKAQALEPEDQIVKELIKQLNH